MRRFRLKLRTLLLIVVVCALTFAIETVRRRRVAFLKLAKQDSEISEFYSSYAGYLELDAEFYPLESQRTVKARLLSDAAAYRKAGEVFAGVQRKYERAARYPWLRVEADPQMVQEMGDYGEKRK